MLQIQFFVGKDLLSCCRRLFSESTHFSNSCCGRSFFTCRMASLKQSTVWFETSVTALAKVAGLINETRNHVICQMKSSAVSELLYIEGLHGLYVEVSGWGILRSLSVTASCEYLSQPLFKWNLFWHTAFFVTFLIPYSHVNNTRWTTAQRCGRWRPELSLLA